MKRYFMLNKPMGYVTARRDSVHPIVMDLFPEAWRYELHPIGRLDIDTEGLLTRCRWKHAKEPICTDAILTKPNNFGG